MSKRKDREFLLDILDAVTRIRSCTERMLFEDFVKDSKTQDAVVRNLEIVGKPSRISPYRAEMPIRKTLEKHRRHERQNHPPLLRTQP